MPAPTDRKYTKTHEWVAIDGESATVGISDHAQEALGDITFIEPPKVGTGVKANAPCGVIESVKAASDLYAPVSGLVMSVNDALESSPETVNSDPYGEGWLFKLAKVNAADIEGLMDAAAYDTFVSSEQ
jgi:glycine cleavage system H protein